MLFCYDTYYPNGGMADFKGSYDTLKQLTEDFNRNFSGFDHHQIFDLETGKINKLGESFYE